MTASSTTTGLAEAGASTVDGSPEPAMRAIRQESLGGPEVLRLIEAARPEPIPTEVLVRVNAAGVNPVDWKTRAAGGFLGSPPFTVGWDVAGVVEAIGGGVTRFAVGDRVFGMPRFPREAAAYAEYVTSPSRQLAHTPERLSDTEAAALPLAALTAWQALVDTADVRPGQCVLVHAGAGGVGHLAVQIAKARGAYVIATARAPKHAFLVDLGVDLAIDYAQQPVEDAVRDVDVVLDTVGGDTLERSWDVLRSGGTLVTILRPPSEEWADGRGARGVFFLVEPNRQQLAEIGQLIDEGRVRPLVEAVYPLAEAQRAYERGLRQHPRGKLVLRVVDED
jgi:NADPH:quinone reductase-like Zn-dependent oxidoreductase